MKNILYITLITVICILVLDPHETMGQRKHEQVTITATVTDASGNPISGALITGREGALEARTDENGRFAIQVPLNSMLLIEARGYESKIVEALQITESLELQKMPFLLDKGNSVAIPFGQIRRRETVGAISTIIPDEIVKYDNVQFFHETLEGRVAGMRGANIRGIGNAVFIVDGIPRDPTNINIEEIDQVTVLKDANAGILYGVHAPNGVVLVSTKRGEAHKRRLNFTAERGVSTPRALPRYLNSAQYMTLYNEARVNDGLAPAFDEDLILQYASGANPYRYPDVDYYSSEFLSDQRPFTKVLSEFSGGNNVTQFYANLGWINTGSLFNVGDAAEAANNRFNVRSNIDIQVTDFIKSFVDVATVFNVNRGPLGDFWSDAATIHPYHFAPLLPLSLLKAEVELSEGINLNSIRRLNGNNILGGSTIYTNNIYGNQAMGSYSSGIDRTVQVNQGIDFDLKQIVEGLRFKTKVGLDIYNFYNQSVNNQYAIYQPVWETTPGGIDSISALTRIGNDIRTGVQNLHNQYFERRFGTNAMFDYSRVFGESHSVSGILVGYFDQLNYQGLLIPQRQAHLGLRLAYDYEKKYFVDFNSALVNGYKLAPGNKSGFSPSLGAAWVLTGEDALSGRSLINYLKLRASAGIINYEFGGNDYKRYLQGFTTAGSFGWDDGNRSLQSVTINRAANPGLTFEKMKNVNVGIEGYFFNHSLYIDANVFATRNSGQVVQRSTYPTYLFNNVPFENYEVTNYSGTELAMIWSKSIGRLGFELGANALYTTSREIRKDELWLEDYQYRKGRPAGARFGLESIGYFADWDDIANSPTQMFGEVMPGDIKYKDQNGDGIIDGNDATYIGNSLARFSYGLSLRVSHGNLSLFLLGTGREGSHSYYSGNYFWIQGDVKYSEMALNRWTPETAATATYPRLSSVNNPNNFRESTHWLYKNNYFNLNRAQVTYVMPRNLARSLFAKDMSIFARGENLLRLSEDADLRLLRIGDEPNFRNYSMGLRIMF